jgi:hypothetical protein
LFLTVAYFLMWGRTLWREDGSVIYSYNCFWALPEQSLLVPSPTELMTSFHCIIWDSPNLEGQVPIFISRNNRMAQSPPPSEGQYWFALLLFMVRNREQYKFNSEVVVSDTRHNNNFHSPTCNVTRFEKGTCYFGFMVFNNLPSSTTTLAHNTNNLGLFKNHFHF